MKCRSFARFFFRTLHLKTDLRFRIQVTKLSIQCGATYSEKLRRLVLVIAGRTQGSAARSLPAGQILVERRRTIVLAIVGVFVAD
jgi:hypothetical protein